MFSCAIRLDMCVRIVSRTSVLWDEAKWPHWRRVCTSHAKPAGSECFRVIRSFFSLFILMAIHENSNLTAPWDGGGKFVY